MQFCHCVNVIEGITMACTLQTYVESCWKSRTQRSWAHPAQGSVFFCHSLSACHSNIIIKNTVNTHTVMKPFPAIDTGRDKWRVSAVAVLDCYSRGCIVVGHTTCLWCHQHMRNGLCCHAWWMLMGNGDVFSPVIVSWASITNGVCGWLTCIFISIMKMESSSSPSPHTETCYQASCVLAVTVALSADPPLSLTLNIITVRHLSVKSQSAFPVMWPKWTQHLL